MLTKERLESYRDIMKEIAFVQEQIDTEPKTTDMVKGSSAEFPYTQHSIKVEGFTEYEAIKIAGWKERLRWLRNEKRAIEDEVDAIQDSEMRRIVTRYYIRGQTQDEIAEKEYCSQKTVSNRLESFFTELSKTNMV